jgi:hypothetical protein
MQEIFRILIGVGILVLGFFLGNLLARRTKEELKSGQKWFRIIIILSLIGGIAGLILGNDYLFFSFSFIAIVASRSIKK